VIPALGSMVGGRYRVDGVLGQGGVGVVLAATDARLSRPVALKLLGSSALSEDEARERFRREARAMASLDSENVVRVFDFGELPGGPPFLVMELLQGETVNALLATCRPLPVATAVGIALDACVGLAHAHAAGLVHRDLKPSNLFFHRNSDGGRIIKLIDFGIVKTLASSLTADSLLLGTARYMSPEQLRSPHVDRRSDLWALGVVLYESLSGEVPFAGGAFEILAGACARPLVELRNDLGAGLSAVVSRCLSPDPERRWPDALALAEALAPYAGTDTTPKLREIARVLGREFVVPVPSAPARSADANETPRPRVTVLLGAAALLGLAVLIVAGILLGLGVGNAKFPRARPADSAAVSGPRPAPARSAPPVASFVAGEAPRHVDPWDLMPVATEEARAALGDVELVRLDIVGFLPDGRVDLAKSPDSRVAYSFRSRARCAAARPELRSACPGCAFEFSLTSRGKDARVKQANCLRTAAGFPRCSPLQMRRRAHRERFPFQQDPLSLRWAWDPGYGVSWIVSRSPDMGISLTDECR
jgi:eukaryotic-like serine/threonine-protein kinase